MMDNDFSADVPEIIESIRTSDVVILKFVSVGERLLIDFRSSPIDGPAIRVIPRVRSLDERRRMLRSMRPRFPEPALMALCWPLYVRSMASTGLLDAISDRLEASGDPDAVGELHRAYGELLGLEETNQRKAISGRDYRTLWSATSATR